MEAMGLSEKLGDQKTTSHSKQDVEESIKLVSRQSHKDYLCNVNRIRELEDRFSALIETLGYELKDGPYFAYTERPRASKV